VLSTMATQSSAPKDPSQNSSKAHRGHEISTKTIKVPSFSYAHLQVISLDVPNSLSSTSPSVSASIKSELDVLTLRSHIMSALSLFLGLSGSAIDVDILKIEGNDCWIRVSREDLSPVLAALGGWNGKSSSDGRVGFIVKAFGNWLGSLVSRSEYKGIWGN